MTSISQVFSNTKLTENGDIAYSTTGNKYADMLFLSEYFTNHPEEVKIGNTEFDKLFAMMVRDPRNGLGMRTYGRSLMAKAGVSPEDTVLAGRFDDLFFPSMRGLEFIKSAVEEGNELAKKWCPRFGSKNKALASKLAKAWGMNKQTYGKFVKVQTTESRLTDKKTNEIKFEQVPSQASIKYSHRFATGEDTKERYAQFIKDVKAGKKELHVATTSPYDIYNHRDDIGFDPDLFFDKLKKISINALAIVDTSASMEARDAMGKALAIGHYIGKCSTFMKDHAITFSSRPTLVHMGVGAVAQAGASDDSRYWNNGHDYKTKCDFNNIESQYRREMESLRTGDCSNTDFAKVMNLLKQVTKDEMPEYLIVLSDMEFDAGSNQSKTELEQLWKENGYTTKIVWWNFNGRHRTVPETDKMGNIFMSGYNPMLLEYLEAGFDANQFIQKLVIEYAKKIQK